jgi:hypothetical protein
MDYIEMYGEEDFTEMGGGVKFLLALVRNRGQKIVNIIKRGWFFRFRRVCLQYLKVNQLLKANLLFVV